METKRQGHFRSRADYIAPLDSGLEDSIRGFAMTAGIEIDQIAAEHEKDHDDDNSIALKPCQLAWRLGKPG